jgi:hypothetical protein
MKQKVDEFIQRCIVSANPVLGILSAIAIISAAVFVPDEEHMYLRRLIWALIVTVPPAWFALEWSYGYTDTEKRDAERRAEIMHSQALYSKFWLAAATGIGLLYFGDSTLEKIIKAVAGK